MLRLLKKVFNYLAAILMQNMADMPPAEMTEAPEPVVEAQGISTDPGHGHRYQSHSL